MLGALIGKKVCAPDAYAPRTRTRPGQPDLDPYASIVLRPLVIIPRMIRHTRCSLTIGSVVQSCRWPYGNRESLVSARCALIVCVDASFRTTRFYGRMAVVQGSCKPSRLTVYRTTCGKRGVILLSPYAAIEPITNIQRFDRKANRMFR